MNQGMKGIELFLAGWMIALVAFYLGGLDTGSWVPLVVSGVEIVGLILIIVGIRHFSEQHINFKAARIVGITTLILYLGIGGVQILSAQGIENWMSITAILLTLSGDIMFMILTGLTLLGFCDLVGIDDNEKIVNRLSYRWVLFLTFAILYILMQTASVLLVNQGLAALTYVVPVVGAPVLFIGVSVVLLLYQIYPQHTELQND
jgi:hypothetical protein